MAKNPFSLERQKAEPAPSREHLPLGQYVLRKAISASLYGVAGLVVVSAGVELFVDRSEDQLSASISDQGAELKGEVQKQFEGILTRVDELSADAESLKEDIERFVEFIDGADPTAEENQSEESEVAEGPAETEAEILEPEETTTTTVANEP